MGIGVSAALGKPFPQEEELKAKSARLIELNAELDMEKQTSVAPEEDAPEKQEKPSIMARLQAQKSQPTTSKPNRSIRNEEVL